MNQLCGSHQDNNLQPLLVDAKNASTMLNISRRTLWSKTSPRGPIPAIRIGRSVKYPVDELKKYVASQVADNKGYGSKA